jgi:hypothetical protein
MVSHKDKVIKRQKEVWIRVGGALKYLFVFPV